MKKTKKAKKDKTLKPGQLSGEEIGALATQMLAAGDRGDRKEVEAIKEKIIAGFYGDAGPLS